MSISAFGPTISNPFSGAFSTLTEADDYLSGMMTSAACRVAQDWTEAPQRDFALVGAKVDLLTGKNLQVSLNYNVEAGRSTSLAQSIYTGLRWQF